MLDFELDKSDTIAYSATWSRLADDLSIRVNHYSKLASCQTLFEKREI